MTSQITSRSRFQWSVVALHLMLLAGLTLLAYGATVGYGFFSEDFDFAYTIAKLPWSSMWHFFLPMPSSGGNAAFYRPMGFLFWRIGGALGGFSAVPQHGINIALHLLNAWLWYALLRRVRQLQPGDAFLAAALFVVFPTHSEDVTWSAGRFDLLAATFGLLTLLCALGIRRSWLASGLAALAFVLALTSKEAALAIPLLAVLLLAAAWWEQPAPRGLWSLATALAWRALPLFVLVGGYLVWRSYLFGDLGGYRVGGTTQQLTLSLADIRRSVIGLLYFLALPLNWPALLRHSATLGTIGWLIAGVMAFLALVGWWGKRRGERTARPLFNGILGIAWGVLAIIPAIGLPSDIVWLESSRFAYLGAMGISLTLAMLIRWLAIRWPIYGTVGASLLAATLITVCSATVAGVNERWHVASDQTQAILADIQAALPAPGLHATLLLPTLPDSKHGAYIFRNGIASAVRIAYNNGSIQSLPFKPMPTGPFPRPDRVYAFVFEDDHLRLHPQQAQIAQAYATQAYTPGLPDVNWQGDFYDEERSADHHWRWLQHDGCIQFDSPQPQHIDLRLHMWSPGPARSAQIDLNGQLLNTITVTSTPQDVVFTNLVLPTGRSCLRVQSSDVQPIDAVLHNGDRRKVSVAVGDMTVNLSAQWSAPIAPQHQLGATFGGRATLLGFDLSRASGAFYTDQQAIVTLYWRCDQPEIQNLQAFVHLVDSTGRVVAQADGPPAGSSTPTSNWQAGQLLRGTFILTAPLDLPPGPFVLRVGLYDPQTQERVPLADESKAGLKLDEWP